MKSQLETLFREAAKALQYPDVPFEVTRPENPHHGEYSTNIAFLLGKVQKTNPIEIAHKLIDFLHDATMSGKITFRDILQDISSIAVAGPGFINLHVTDHKLISQSCRLLNEKEIVETVSTLNSHLSALKKRIIVEFSHPNTHKAFHIGHLRNITTGESLVRLLERVGNTVIRANYQGDVGMHIAKCLYGLQTSDFRHQTSEALSLHQKVELLGKAYAAGSKAYEEDEGAKNKIGEINKQIYSKDPAIYPLYEKTRKWSLDYFDSIYKRVGSHFDRLYFESEVYETGKKNVENGLAKGIFEKSDGAIIFPGEKFGLHNRVFITGEGNPTYEGKEMGLGPLQFAEQNPDKIIHLVGPEQASYFEVCFEALAQLFPETRGKEFHQSYGWVKLKHGKMSSRTGNVVLGEWLLDEIKTSIYKIIEQSVSDYLQAEKDHIAEVSAIAAVKYAFLKVGLSQELAFDIEESINIHGDSGPYLLYTYARCMSVFRKVAGVRSQVSGSNGISDLQLAAYNPQLNPEEHLLARHLSYYPEIVVEAGSQLSPSHVARYLTELAQLFNVFYAKHQILGDKETKRLGDKENDTEANQQFSPFDKLRASNVTMEQSCLRLALTRATAAVLKDGLWLIGIETVERM